MVKRQRLSILILFFSTFSVYAQSIEHPVLPIGAKIVAGDLSQNEFYILAPGQSLSRAAVKKPNPIIAKKTVVASKPKAAFVPKVIEYQQLLLSAKNAKPVTQRAPSKQSLVAKLKLKEVVTYDSYKGEKRRVIKLVPSTMTASNSDE